MREKDTANVVKTLLTFKKHTKNVLGFFRNTFLCMDRMVFATNVACARKRENIRFWRTRRNCACTYYYDVTMPVQNTEDFVEWINGF